MYAKKKKKKKKINHSNDFTSDFIIRPRSDLDLDFYLNWKRYPCIQRRKRIATTEKKLSNDIYNS